MDYFSVLRKNVEGIREQATLAASKARHFAEDVSEKAQGLATVATANAKVVAEKLKEDAKGLAEQTHWQDAAEKAKSTILSLSPFQSTQTKATLDLQELKAYGITDSYKSFVRSLDYSTFRDFNEEQLHTSIGFVVTPDGSLRLNPWQERHAVLALRVFDELDHLRYLLCPKRMTEEKFWLVYFSLAQPQLPEGCKTGKLPDLTSVDAESRPVLEMAPLGINNAEKVSSSDEESEKDDLDKYLNDVLHEDTAGVASQEEEFEDLEGYMEQLNAEMGSQHSQDGVSSDMEILDSVKGASDGEDAPVTNQQGKT